MNTQFYEGMLKKVKHPHLAFVSVVRRKCAGCDRPFRHYATGVDRSLQTITVKTLCVFLYSMGLSYSQIVSLLENLGIGIAKSTVWRNVRSAGRKAYCLHRLSKKGEVSVGGMSADLLGNRQPEVLLSLVAGLLEGRSLEIELPDAEGRRVLNDPLPDAAATQAGCSARTRRPFANRNAASTDVDHPAVASLRRGIARRCLRLRQEVTNLMKSANRKERTKLQELLDDLRAALHVAEESNNDCEPKFWAMYKKYAHAKSPQKGERATIWYKMRLFTLRLWDRSSRILEQCE
jgi:hypothetical protein